MKLEGYEEFRSLLTKLKNRLVHKTPGKHETLSRRVSVAEIEEALERIKEGTYGICQACFLVMPRGPLLMQPYARICNECRARHARQVRQEERQARDLEAAPEAA